MINGVMIMKEKAVKVLKYVLFAAISAFCVTDTAEVAAAVGKSVDKCVEVVIPSLFAMMVISSLFIRSGLNGHYPRWLGKFSRTVFGMEGYVFPIFTFGMFAGYPVGVKMLCDEYSAGRLSKRRAELLSGLCFGAGPAFVFGCISRQLYSSDRAGLIILISNIAANVLLALIMSVPLRRTFREHTHNRCGGLSADMLTDCVMQSGRAMGRICVMIVFFSVFSAFFSRTGAAAAGELLAKLPDLDRESGKVIVAALFDVTNTGDLPCGDWLLLPYISAATAFGGLCVMMQISGITAGRLSLRPFILLRSAAAVLSFCICRLITPLLMVGETVSVSAVKAEGVSSRTPVPSVLLIIMTAMLMLEFDKKRERNTA